MTVVFSDSFTRADNDNPGSDWVEHSGDWDIVSNTLRAPSNTGTPSLIRTAAAAHSDLADMKVSVVHVATSLDGGPTVRHSTSAETMYYVEAYTGTLDLVRRVSGGDTLVATASQTLTAGRVIALEASGTGASVTLKVYYNAVLKINTTDSNAARITAAGRAGILSWDEPDDFDNFEVDDLAAAAATSLPPIRRLTRVWNRRRLT